MKNKIDPHQSNLSLEEVVELGYCVGCGGCSVGEQAAKMLETPFGTYQPDLLSIDKKQRSNAEEKVCPFTGQGPDEDELGQSLFADNETDIQHSSGVGYYVQNYAGYASTAEFRKQGSSGGLLNWLCATLLSENVVDEVLHVKPDTTKASMYSYQSSSSVDELVQGAKSKYYPIHAADVLSKVLATPNKTYAFVGLPCFIKMVRVMQLQYPELQERIKVTVGLVCGHLKSKRFAELLGWQAGIPPENLQRVDFRTKLKYRPASKYAMAASTRHPDRTDTWVVKPMEDVLGGNWGHGFLKIKACEFCDDVMAETADIALGDAWLPQYVKESLGTNVVTVRTRWLQELLESAQARNAIYLEEISATQVEQSQGAGLRHRREGLSYRLKQAAHFGIKAPKKRVSPAMPGDLDEHRAQTYQWRELLRQTSHQAFYLARQQNNLSVFIEIMQPLVAGYQKHLDSETSQQQSRFTRQLKALRKKLIRTVKHWLGRDCHPL